MTITLIRAVIIYVTVVIAVRIMGKRQIGELDPHELVITILISSVATIPLEDNAIPLTNSLLPIMIFISLEILESAISMKWMKFRNLLQGKPIIIIKDGKLQQKEMVRLRFTVNDVIDSLRQKDVFDISEVENAVVETNGSLSVQLKNENAPLTPKTAREENSTPTMPITVIADGKAVEEYFGNETVRKSEIKLILASADKKLEDIMYMSIDSSGKIYIIEKEKEE